MCIVTVQRPIHIIILTRFTHFGADNPSMSVQHQQSHSHSAKVLLCDKLLRNLLLTSRLITIDRNPAEPAQHTFLKESQVWINSIQFYQHKKNKFILEPFCSDTNYLKRKPLQVPKRNTRVFLGTVRFIPRCLMTAWIVSAWGGSLRMLKAAWCLRVKPTRQECSTKMIHSPSEDRGNEDGICS